MSTQSSDVTDIVEKHKTIIEASDSSGDDDVIFPTFEDDPDALVEDTTELSDEMKSLQESLTNMGGMFSDPTVFDPGSENYNPLIGQSIGKIFKQFLQFTQSMGLRTIVDMARVVDIRHINGEDVEVEVPMKRSRVEDILEDRVEPTPEEYQTLVTVLEAMVVKDKAHRDRMKAKHPDVRQIPSRMKTRGLTRTQRRAIKADERKKKNK